MFLTSNSHHLVGRAVYLVVFIPVWTHSMFSSVATFTHHAVAAGYFARILGKCLTTAIPTP